MAARLKKGDKVVVMAGKDKGKKGEILSLFPKEEKAIVGGVNMVQRHTRPSAANPEGGILAKEAKVHLSNLMIEDPKDGSPTRVGFRIDGEKKVRFAKKSGEVIDG